MPTDVCVWRFLHKVIRSRVGVRARLQLNFVWSFLRQCVRDQGTRPCTRPVDVPSSRARACATGALHAYRPHACSECLALARAARARQASFASRASPGCCRTWSAESTPSSSTGEKRRPAWRRRRVGSGWAIRGGTLACRRVEWMVGKRLARSLRGKWGGGRGTAVLGCLARALLSQQKNPAPAGRSLGLAASVASANAPAEASDCCGCLAQAFGLGRSGPCTTYPDSWCGAMLRQGQFTVHVHIAFRNTTSDLFRDHRLFHVASPLHLNLFVFNLRRAQKVFSCARAPRFPRLRGAPPASGLQTHHFPTMHEPPFHYISSRRHADPRCPHACPRRCARSLAV
eukprot:1720765-Pleurochrysis_carterae.AAC.1